MSSKVLINLNFYCNLYLFQNCVVLNLKKFCVRSIKMIKLLAIRKFTPCPIRLCRCISFSRTLVPAYLFAVTETQNKIVKGLPFIHSSTCKREFVATATFGWHWHYTTLGPLFFFVITG